MKNSMKLAHQMTKEIKKEYPEVDYKFQLGLCLSFLSKNKEENKMVELEGSEKQIKWAEDIRKEMLGTMEEDLRKMDERYNTEKFADKPNHVKALKIANEIVEKIKNETKATWFINYKWVNDRVNGAAISDLLDGGLEDYDLMEKMLNKMQKNARKFVK